MTRGLTSVDEVTNCLHAQIMIDKLSEDLQWRSAGRQNDDRPGMSKFFNVLAVYCVTYLVVYRYLVYWIFQYSVSFPISVVLNVYCEGRNSPKLPPLRISQLIQKSRKQAAKRYRGKGGRGERLAIPDNSTPQREENFHVRLQKRIGEIETGIASYRRQNRPTN